MIFPNAFPFDVLDPAPDYCGGCGCDLRRADGSPQSTCRYPGDCECHEEWRSSTDDLLKREMWGGK